MYNLQGVYVLDCTVKMLSSSSKNCYTQLSFPDGLVKAESRVINAFFRSLASAAAMSSFTVCVQTIFGFSMVWYQKRVNKNGIRLLTCNNLFITYYMLKKGQATELKYKKALIKLQSNSSCQIWRQASSKILTCNPIGSTKLLQYIWLDNSNPWSNIISIHSVNDIISLHGYHFCSRLYHTDMIIHTY